MEMECQGMACKVSCVSVKTKLIKQLLHRLCLAVETFPRPIVAWIVLLDVDEH